MNETSYHLRVGQIVNLVREYDAASCRTHAIRYIRSAKVSEGGYVWLGVMLVEWASAINSKARRQMTHRDFRKILNRMIALQSHTNGPTECQSAIAWLRRVSYQQFPYQRRISRIDIGRQLIIFGENGCAARLGRGLADAVGIKVRDFLILCMALLTHILTNNGFSFSLSWFQPLRDSLTSGSIERFIEVLTCDGRFEQPVHESGYYEKSRLFRRPLIRTTAQNGMPAYEYLHEAHVGEALSEFIHDTLKSIDANKFMGEFGNCFSKYLSILLSEAGIDPFTESDLKKAYDLEGFPVVDFMIREEDASILMEAKAIEANPAVMSTASGHTLGQRLRDTVLKAIKQARSTAERISRGVESHDEFFLIVITYKQLYLATGEIIRECIDPKTTEIFDDESECPSLIPFENIFVISVDEFERLITAVKQRKTSIVEFLNKVKNRQKEGGNRRFIIGQHLNELGFLDFPQSLYDVATSAFEEMELILTPPAQ